jgi:hypothetical protein
MPGLHSPAWIRSRPGHDDPETLLLVEPLQVPLHENTLDVVPLRSAAKELSAAPCEARPVRKPLSSNANDPFR